MVTFQFMYSNNYHTRVETIDQNYNTKNVELCIDSNHIQSSLCCLLSENDLYKFYIIDSAATYENKNQIIIFPENSGLLKTEYETYKLKNGGINSIFLWESLEFTYYWTGNNFEIIMFD
jgi:hypothetical protein